MTADSNVRRLPARARTGAKPPRRMPSIDGLTITDHPPPADEHPHTGGGKYGPLFSALQLGQCLACPSTRARSLANNLRQWLRARGRSAERVVYRPHGGPDGEGGVWLLPPLPEPRTGGVRLAASKAPTEPSEQKPRTVFAGASPWAGLGATPKARRSAMR